jgi:hypothetical protein
MKEGDMLACSPEEKSRAFLFSKAFKISKMNIRGII